MSLDNTFGYNKDKYKQYRVCLSTLLRNVYHDAVSGWLMVASLFYKTKQYRKALHIIMYAITKCSPEKLYNHVTMSYIHYQMLKLRSLNKKNIVFLLKIMFVNNVQFQMNSTLAPHELQTGILDTIHLYPSTAYAYFLNFLCHYHLNNVRHCQDSLTGLRLIIDENYLMSRIALKTEAYNLLGIALQLFGDKGSAREAFLQSVDYSRIKYSILP